MGTNSESGCVGFNARPHRVDVSIYDKKPALRAAGASLAVIAYLSAAPALAQEVELEEIIVTAQKREESIQKVPVSIQAVTGEVIAEQGVGGLEALSQSVPTLQVGSGGLSEQLFIRGIGSGSNQGFEQSTGTYLDGIYFGIARLSRLAFLDVERVEVLKGPQSTLFGKSTIAGAINIASARPRADFSGGLDFRHQFEGGEEMGASGFVTGELRPGVMGRFAFATSAEKGGFDNTYLDKTQPREESVAARGSLLFEPTERLEILATLQGSYASTNGRSQQLGYMDLRFPRVVTLYNQVLALDPDADFTIDDRRSAGRTGSDKDEMGFDRAFVGTVNAAYDFDFATLKSVTGLVDAKWGEDIDSDGTPVPIFDTYLGQDISQFSQELRLESNPGGRLDYIAGLYYQANDIDVPLTYSEYNLAIAGVAQSMRSCSTSQRNESNWGVFGQATWAATERLRVTAGARYQEAEREISMQRVIGDPGSCDPTSNATRLAVAASALGHVPFSISESSGDNHVTPSATVEFDLFDGGLVYATYRTGFKSGGFDLGAGRYNPLTFQYAPEKAESWEVGAKMRLLDGRARLNINAFDSKFEDLQVSAFNGTGFTVGNAAEARSRGVEVQAEAIVLDGLRVTLDAAWLDAKYEDFPGAQCYANQATVGVGCVGGRQNLAGHVLPFSPEWSAAMRVDYRKSFGDYEGFAQATVNYRSEQEVGPDGDPNRLVDAATKVDLRIGARTADERLEVALLGKNLTDEMTASFGYNVPLVAGAYIYQVDPPRTIALQISTRF